MNITQQLEEKFGVKIENLNSVEKQTYFEMLDIVQKSQLTPESLRGYIVSMREAVTKELVDEPEFNYIFIFKVPNRKQILLKARLQNYMLLEAFLGSSEKAKQALEEMVSNLTRGA